MSAEIVWPLANFAAIAGAIDSQTNTTQRNSKTQKSESKPLVEATQTTSLCIAGTIHVFLQSFPTTSEPTTQRTNLTNNDSLSLTHP